ncbi:MAG: alkaline phosphatase family protein [Muribaculaceae bacterium]|nr:alkaline phosphatase family protein [Muribaculaceae bacterium]
MSKKLIYSPARTAAALALLATLAYALPAKAADNSASRRPQLVLGIMVDGLRADYLQLLSDYFGPDGFNRLTGGGVLIENVDYGPGVDRAGAIAMICTGASPSVNGIATERVYDTSRHLDRPALYDAGKIGNYTDETLSPSALLTSTLADELRIDGAGASYVHAIAPDATCAIIMGGHAGNSAFWINDANGNWATTTHYKDVPTPVSNRNFIAPLSVRIDTMRWEPSMKLESYPGLPPHKRRYPFSHTFSRGDADVYRLFKQSAPVNTEVTTLAGEYIKSMRLGQRGSVDMLNIGYTLAPYPGSGDTDSRLEVMDSYLRLDRELARLFKIVDESVGPDNSVVLLAGTPAKAPTDPYEPQWGVPTGEFSSRKAQSLLNMFLIARYGNGEWVTDYHDGAFYLNQQLIDSKRLDAEAVRAEAAKFLCRMSGVASAHTIDDILENRFDDKLRRNTVAANAADVFITILPGWQLVDDFNPLEKKRTTQRTSPATAPVVIYAPAVVDASRIDTPVDALQIAPTMARILRIRSPNGAGEPSLSSIFVRKAK